ncbi:MAG TPA: hypothetical protein VK612_03335 [Pyrinomonadaceae bacterium]|nr:hypothetical protein [Pyrinomonadaceae bacterium]
MSFVVRLKPETFKNNNNVTGVIYLELNGNCFPDNLWFDFPVIILGWWLENLRPVIQGRSIGVKCYFMDGPVRFEVTAQTATAWHIQFIKDELEGLRNMGSGSVSPKDMINAILDAARIAIDLSIENNWRSRDLEMLESEYSLYVNDPVLKKYHQ